MSTSFNTAKFLVFAGTLFIIVMFSGCNDDDEEPNQEIDLIGFWTVSNVEINDIAAGEQPLVDFFVNVGGLSQENAAIAYALVESSILASISGTIDIRRNQTYTSVLGGETVNGTWAQSADGKTVTIYDDTDDELVATINSLTLTMAKLSFLYKTYQDIDANPLSPDVLLNVEGDITLTR